MRVAASVGEQGLRITLEGELDLAGRGALLDFVAAQPVDGRDVAVDLSALTFIDSTGCRTLLDIDASIRERGASSIDMTVARDGPVWRVLHLVGLDSVLRVRPV